ncbi:MAG: hypothetical protein J6R47_03470, partial [Acholeplasmatales bacterium]|nr:hypothetical protein [Acholeplasmatales bacterium]
MGVYKAEVVDFVITYNGKNINKDNYQITVINGDFIRYEITKRDLHVMGIYNEYSYNGNVVPKLTDPYYLLNVVYKDIEYI